MKKALTELTRAEKLELARTVQSLKARVGDKGPQNDEELWQWIIDNLGMTMPRVPVTEGHTTPFWLIADLYFQRTNTAFALGSRGSSKTMGVAVVNVLNGLYKKEFEAISAGAIMAQSNVAYNHFQKFMRKFPEAIISSSITKTKFINGGELSIMPGTIASLNGPHVQLMHLDELEIFDPAAREEANNIPVAKTLEDGTEYKTQVVLTSTRKRPGGPVQKTLDLIESSVAEGSTPPYKLYKWNCWDVAKPVGNCRVANPDLPEEEKCDCNQVSSGKWEDDSVRTFDQVCGGKLARSEGWIPLNSLQNIFRTSTRDTWEAQQECLKPSKEGLVYPKFNKEIHGIRKYNPDPEFGPIYQGIDFGGCYDRETEVLTDRGWISFVDASRDFKYASLNPETEKVEFVEAECVINKFYPGEFHHYKNNQIDLVVSDDHNMFVYNQDKNNPKIIRSTEVTKSQRFKKNSLGRADSVKQNFVLPGAKSGHGKFYESIEIDSEDWAAFMGLWFAEGHTDPSRNKGKISKTAGKVGITYYNKDNIEEISKILSKYFKVNNYKDYESKRGQLIINDIRLYQHLRPLGKATEKRLPDYIKSWDKSLLDIYLDWHKRGDGNRNRIYTSSKLLADDLQEICMYAGLSANIKSRKRLPVKLKSDNKLIKSLNTQYEVNIVTHHNMPDFYLKKDKRLQRETLPAKWREVFCVHLEKNHTLYVRRKGKPVWSGNTNPFYAGWVQVLNCEVEVLRYDNKSIILKEGTRVLFNEIYKAEISNTQFAQEIVNVENYYKSMYDNWSVTDRFADPAGKAARLELRRFKPKLPTHFYATREQDEHIKEVTKLIENDLLYVDIGECPMFIEEIEVYPYEEKKPDEVDKPIKPVKDFDHAMDGSRYVFANIAKIELNNERYKKSAPGTVGRGVTGKLRNKQPKAASMGTEPWRQKFGGVPLGRERVSGRR